MKIKWTCSLLAAAAAALLPDNGLAFSSHCNPLSLARSTRLPTCLASNSKDEEIAKLEEQLRKLKEETEDDKEEAPVEVATVSPATEETAAAKETSLDVDDFVGRGPAKRPVKPMEEMMSETWKAEQKDPAEQEGGGNAIITVVAGIVLVAFLAFFSQVPVGQEDLTKYQAIKTSTSIDLGDINPARSGDF